MPAAKKASLKNKETWPKGVAKPAQRALASAGITKLDQLASARKADLAALHGMGPKALGILESELRRRGKSFRAG